MKYKLLLDHLDEQEKAVVDTMKKEIEKKINNSILRVLVLKQELTDIMNEKKVIIYMINKYSEDWKEFKEAQL